MSYYAVNRFVCRIEVYGEAMIRQIGELIDFASQIAPKRKGGSQYCTLTVPLAFCQLKLVLKELKRVSYLYAGNFWMQSRIRMDRLLLARK